VLLPILGRVTFIVVFLFLVLCQGQRKTKEETKKESGVKTYLTAEEAETGDEEGPKVKKAIVRIRKIQNEPVDSQYQSRTVHRLDY